MIDNTIQSWWNISSVYNYRKENVEEYPSAQEYSKISSIVAFFNSKKNETCNINTIKQYSLIGVRFDWLIILYYNRVINYIS